MGLGKGMAWLFLRNTEVGKKILGERAVREQRLGRLARIAYQKSLEQHGRGLQYQDEDCEVLVKMASVGTVAAT